MTHICTQPAAEGDTPGAELAAAEKLAKAYKDADCSICDIEGVEVVCEGDWTQDCKLQLCETIVRFDGQLFGIQETRTGSYHTDWHYEAASIYPVERREEIKTVVSYPQCGASVETRGGF